jgi:hypothetical protein
MDTNVSEEYAASISRFIVIRGGFDHLAYITSSLQH